MPDRAGVDCGPVGQAAHRQLPSRQSLVKPLPDNFITQVPTRLGSPHAVGSDVVPDYAYPRWLIVC